MQPFTVGLTGGIGSGKSTVAGILKELGAELQVGDELGREALDQVRGLRQRIIERFGDDLIDAVGAIDRRALADRVFANLDHVRWLTDQTHPYIHARWREAVARTQATVIVFDAALIFEWEIESEFDRIVVVHAPEEIVIERCGGGRFTPEELTSRLRAQVPIERKLAKADVVIDNSGNLDQLRSRVVAIWNDWQGILPRQSTT